MIELGAFKWNELFGLIQALATCVGVGVAWWGVDRWRREQIGGRQAELAEDAIALAYEAQEVFDHVRNPFSFGGEGSSREAQPNESDDLKRRRDQYFVPFERIGKHREYFESVRKLRGRVIALFGESAAQHLTEILRISRDFQLACQMHNELSEDLLDAPDTELSKEKREHAAIKWKGSKTPDVVDERLSKLRNALELQFKPIFTSRYK